MKSTLSQISVIIWFFVLAIIPVIYGCKGQENANTSKKSSSDNIDIVLNFNWFHSHEEGGGDSLTFRHKPFVFPPARGRVGFKLMENNQLEYWAIGATDIPEKLNGSWSLEKGDFNFSVSGNERVNAFEMSYRILKAEKDLFILLRK